MTHCSENADRFFEAPVSELLGVNFNSLFDSPVRHEINNFLGSSISLHRSIGVLNHSIEGSFYRIFLHRLETYFLIEIEAIRQPELDPEGLIQEVQSLLFMMSKTDKLSEKINLALEGVRRLCGVDRVVFMTPETKKILIKDSVQGPFLPKLVSEDLLNSDVSEGKYKRLQNLRVDFVNDFNAQAVRLLSHDIVNKMPDTSLTMGVGRSFLSSDLLKSQNVRNSASFALIIRNRLWGVLECHHTEPLYLSPMKRQMLLLFMENFGFQLEVRGAAK